MTEMQIGESVTQAGQVYTLLRLEPFQRRNRQMMELGIYGGICPDCGAGFEVRATIPPPAYLRRRCDACRKPGVRVGGEAAAALTRERRKRAIVIGRKVRRLERAGKLRLVELAALTHDKAERRAMQKLYHRMAGMA